MQSNTHIELEDLVNTNYFQSGYVMNTTLLVFDDDFLELNQTVNAVSFEAYLRDYPKIHEERVRIINLCDTKTYLSQGYYCSLLAEARRHEVIPSVRMINMLRQGQEQGIWFKAEKVDVNDLNDGEQVQLLMCMGEVNDPRFQKLASSMFSRYPVPLLSVSITCFGRDVRVQLRRKGLKELNSEELDFCWQVLEQYARLTWRKQNKGKSYRWNMAMLVNPNEPNPPSNKAALNSFIRAGKKLGIQVDAVTAEDILHINHYDALFIRETTAIDHHTYRIACEAEENGLVVVDDPNSILRCCNKVFLHDAFNYQKVPSLKTIFVNSTYNDSIELIESEFDYPVVLKMPEGSFSKGVFKINNRDELTAKLAILFKESALVLAQEFLYTEYDWRIGVLNGRALYACQYHMAKSHWQIYNHGSKRNSTGGFETLPTFEIPRIVLNAALKGSAVVGKGLYGVDIKMSDNRAYVIEVNDNPNLDHGIEDKYLGEELYMQIMSEFLRQLELRGIR